jgi:hypothetical protein
MTVELNLTSRVLVMMQNDVQELNYRILQLEPIDRSTPFTWSESTRLQAEIRSLEIDIQIITNRNLPRNIGRESTFSN